MNKKYRIGLAALLVTAGLIGCASGVSNLSERDAAKRAGEVMRASFAAKGIAGMDRLDQDEVQALCTEYADKKMPPEIADRIQKSQLATIRKPASGNLIGDWKAGEKLAQEGRGFQFSDAADGPKGANCYACHQLTPQEISFGNLGPSLLKYGALRGNSPAIVEYTYNKVFNSHAYSACSNMPRFGYKNILTPEQIADVLALLLDPESPVNK
ncbi:hypothetical protein BH11PSE11_BH11PSE11_09150 [soil metagenome]